MDSGKVDDSYEEFIYWTRKHTDDIYNAWIAGALNSAVIVVGENLLENLMNDRWLKFKSHDY
ncbi:11048_t:CDS:2 [Funneliformis mosseae]|uniref:11048_t:CDS:1 n=1 Tax=Funneliformis mosseae TaxID=27381 RepID=A0A9N9AKA8_FUNMO|nr:11048_t:CDS:2 [Funneliformis mosseae]